MGCVVPCPVPIVARCDITWSLGHDWLSFAGLLSASIADLDDAGREARIQHAIYAVFFDQKGLMAGLGCRTRRSAGSPGEPRWGCP